MNNLKCTTCKNMMTRVGPFTCQWYPDGIPDETLETGCEHYDSCMSSQAGIDVKEALKVFEEITGKAARK